MSKYEMDHAEVSTVLAALRFYQSLNMGEPDSRPGWVHEIATDGGTVMASLDSDGISELCERINISERKLTDEQRKVVIEKLCADRVESAESLALYLWDIMEQGFVGFSSMSDAELLECFASAFDYDFLEYEE